MKNSSSMIQVETRLELVLEQPMDALFHLGAHPDRLDRLCGSEVIAATQTDGSTLDLHSDMFFDPFGNPVIRARLLPGTTTIDYAFRGTASSASKPAEDLPFIAVNDLPSNVLQYLKPSRYVDSDRVGPLAFEIIGDEVMAGRQTHRLFEWVTEHVRYEPGSSVLPLSTREVIDQQVGVCRDLAHALIGLLRAISLPARYVVGYAQELEPQDIHAWVEVFLDNAWYELDPSFQKMNNGRAGLIHGRDAADVAIMDQFGPLPLISKQSVQVL